MPAADKALLKSRCVYVANCFFERTQVSKSPLDGRWEYTAPSAEPLHYLDVGAETFQTSLPGALKLAA